MNDTSSVQVVLAAFAAIERRDQAAFARSCQPDAEFCWPPSLPYGRTVRGLTDRTGAGWEAYWNPLQPTAGHRRLNPRVIAATEEEVVVLWRQGGVTPAGDSINTEVLGLYRVRAGKLARAQMFYFDPASVVSFLAKAIPAGPDQATDAEDPSAGGTSSEAAKVRRTLRVQASGQVFASRIRASPQPRPGGDGAMKITNSHERIVAAPPERIAALIADFDRVWPTQIAPAPRRQGHRLYDAGLMLWEEFDRPGAARAFRVIRPDELQAEHWFELEPAEGSTVLRHVIEGCAAGKYEAIWRERIEPLHNLILEALLDNVEAAVPSGD